MTRTLQDYRPQHDEECAARRCVGCTQDVDHPIHMTDRGHFFRGGSCSCGLDTLLASLRVQGAQLQEEKKNDLGAVSATGVDAVPCLVHAESASHDGAKRLRVFGPHDNPDEANCYFGEADGDLRALIAQLREYLPQMTERERFVIRVQALTDSEVEALPDL